MFGMIAICLALSAVDFILNSMRIDPKASSGTRVHFFLFDFARHFVSDLDLFIGRLTALLVLLAVVGLVAIIKNADRQNIVGHCKAGIDVIVNASLLAQLSVGIIISVMLATFVSALAPVTSWDATVAHIALPADYWRDGRVHLIEGNAYSGYPQYLHALYAVVYGISGESGAALLSWLMLPAGCAALFGLGKQFHHTETGLVAAGIFAAAPLVAQQAGTVSIDLAFAALTLTAFGLWLRALNDEFPRPTLCVAAILAGASCGIRHTGFVVCALLALFTLIEHRKQIKLLVMPLMLMAAAALPSLMYTWVNTGNPFYPLLAEVFPSPAMPDIQDTRIGAHETFSMFPGRSFCCTPGM